MLILLFLFIIILNLFTLIFPQNICSYSYNNNKDLFINISNETIQSIILTELNYYISNLLHSDKNVYVRKNNNIIISISSNLLCSKELAYNENLIYIDLKECINLIKSNESIETPLIIVQIELERRTEKTNQLLYFVSDKNGNKINVEKICNNLYFNSTFPFNKSTLLNYDYGKEILEQYKIDIFNSNIDFYNDICYKFEYNKKDILIEDRRKIFYKNVSFCDENCDYSEIDYENNRIECNCKILNEEFVKFTESQFLKKFPKGINKSNLNIFKCNKLIKANIGFIIILILVCLQFPEFLIFFIATKLKNLKLYIINDQKKQKKFKKIEVFEVEAPNEENYVEDENDEEFNEEENESEENSENNENSNKESESNIKSNKESNNDPNLKKNVDNEFTKNNSINEKNSNYSKDIKYYNPMNFQPVEPNPPKNKKHSDSSSSPSLNEPKTSKKNKNKKQKKIKNVSDIKTNNLLFQIIEPNNKNSIVLNEKDYIKHKKNKPINLNIFDYNPEKKVEPVKEPSVETQKLEWTKRKKIVVQHKINFTDDQMDAFDFKFALENDSRTFCSLFCHIFCNNIFPFSQLSCSPFEPILIKLSFIFFSFIIIIGFNAFCYFFKYIHKRFNSNKNKFNFGYCFSSEIDRSLLAGFFSFAMQIIINVSLLKYKLKFENILLKYKIMKEKGYFNEINRLIDRLRITIIIYVVFNYIIILIFWIYVMIFCELFKNNINGLIFSSIISIFFIIIYCFIFCAIIAGLRLLSLKKNYQNLYNVLKYFI